MARKLIVHEQLEAVMFSTSHFDFPADVLPGEYRVDARGIVMVKTIHRSVSLGDQQMFLAIELDKLYRFKDQIGVE